MLKKIFGVKSSSIMTNAEVEKEMKVEDGQKLGESEELLLFGGFQELNGYYFFEALFVSRTDIKSKRGATITFKGTKGEFTLQSSLQEFESDRAKALQRQVSQISFDITKNQITKIQKGQYDTIEFKVKKKVFSLLKAK